MQPVSYNPIRLPDDRDHLTGIRIESAESGADNEKSGVKAYSNGKPLSDKEQRKVEQLKRIDAEVRAHESAHQASAGSLARGKSFGYVAGPDGKQYAVSGEVQIDVSVVAGNPQATIAKMRIVRSAALAPSDPSGQDKAVAAQAAKVEAQARSELSLPQNEEALKDVSQSPSTSGNQKIVQPSVQKTAEKVRMAYSSNSLPLSTFSVVETCYCCNRLTACGDLSAGMP